MKPDWFLKEDHEHRRRLTGLWHPYCAEDRHFLALSLCGEVGELANKIKKHWDGRIDPPSMEEIAEEVADVRILMELVAHTMTIDIDAAVERKLAILADRENTRSGKSRSRIETKDLRNAT